MRQYRRSIANLLIAVAVVILTTGNIGSAPAGSDIDNLKAAFIYNFTKYIKWSESEPDSSFTIGVLGDSEVLGSIREMAVKKQVDDQPISVVHYHNIDELDFCHILFVSESESNRIKELLATLGTCQTLTVGDTRGFCEQGIMINFFMQSGRVKFEMNPSRLEKTGLRASSQLQKLARIVQ